MKIVIIDYGMGNIKSITSALNYIGVEKVLISNKSEDIDNSDKIILPGVGSFSKAMRNIEELGLKELLTNAVVSNKKPILGICLGMQLMADSSDENGITEGLKLISGKVEKFKTTDIKIPHVGFNQVEFEDNSRLYNGLNDVSDFYFTHSFRLSTKANINQSLCMYGEKFIASYECGNIAGVQFHPELSQTNGLQLLSNFVHKF